MKIILQDFCDRLWYGDVEKKIVRFYIQYILVFTLFYQRAAVFNSEDFL
jgi:hypothetical protein